MVIVPLPRNSLRSVEWTQSGGRAGIQRSAFGGRSRELVDLGPSPRWTAECEPVPVRSGSAADLAWAGFEAACQQPGAVFRLPATEGGQQPASLIRNGELDSGSAAGWQFPPPAAAGVSQFGAGLWLFATGPAAGAANGSVLANGGAVTPLAGASRLWVSARAWRGATAAGLLAAGLYWFDGSGGFLSASLVDLLPASAPVGQLLDYAEAFAPPAGAAGWRFQLDNAMTDGLAFAGGFRVASLPSRAYVVAPSAGRILSLSGLGEGLNLRAGQFVTVALPDGDEQLVRLASDLVGDATESGVVELATPLRRPPLLGAAVELDRPWALMRATHEAGWAVAPGPIRTNRLTCEEAF